MSEDLDFSAQTIIFEELQTVPGPRKVAGDTVMVQCPFHDDGSPSCGVYVASGMEIPIGYFNCFGCGAKGHWNKLADKLGLQKIQDWQAAVVGDNDGLLRKAHDMEKALLSERSFKNLIKSMGNFPTLPWIKDVPWRTYSGELIQACEGHMLLDTRFSEDDDTMVCFFPVAIGREYYGGVKAYLDKQVGRLSYVTTKGDWVKQYGLFPFNLTRDLIKRRHLDYVVLVEGPRDALRLLTMGIPALAVLGSNNLSNDKLNVVLRMGVNQIYSLADNDPAGDKMRKTLKNMCNEMGIDYKSFNLPKKLNKKGELIKLDPDNCKEQLIVELRGYLRDTHGRVLRRNVEWYKDNS